MERLNPQHDHAVIVGYNQQEGKVFVQFAEPLSDVKQEVCFQYPLRSGSGADRLMELAGPRAGAFVRTILPTVKGVRAINVNPYQIDVHMGPLTKVDEAQYRVIVKSAGINLHLRGEDVFDLWELEDAMRELQNLEQRIKNMVPTRWNPKWRPHLNISLQGFITLDGSSFVDGLIAWELKSFEGNRTYLGKYDEVRNKYFTSKIGKTQLEVREEAALEKARQRYDVMVDKAEALRNYIASY